MQTIIIYVVGIALGFALLYSVIFMAVRSALDHHYKVVRWYEATGEWLPRTGTWRQAPTAFGAPPKKPLTWGPPIGTSGEPDSTRDRGRLR